MPLTPDQVNRELAQIIANLADAASKRDKGITLDLTPIAQQATKLCEEIINLPPNEAMTLLPDLQSAIEQLNNIHESVQKL